MSRLKPRPTMTIYEMTSSQNFNFSRQSWTDWCEPIYVAPPSVCCWIENSSALRYCAGVGNASKIWGMTTKKSKRDIAIEKITSLFIEHMQKTLTPAQGKALIKDLKTFS